MGFAIIAPLGDNGTFFRFFRLNTFFYLPCLGVQFYLSANAFLYCDLFMHVCFLKSLHGRYASPSTGSKAGRGVGWREIVEKTDRGGNESAFPPWEKRAETLPVHRGGGSQETGRPPDEAFISPAPPFSGNMSSGKSSNHERKSTLTPTQRESVPSKSPVPGVDPGLSHSPFDPHHRGATPEVYRSHLPSHLDPAMQFHRALDPGRRTRH